MGVVKTWNGIARASLKTWDGIAAASVKTINGLDATTGGTPPSIANAWKAVGTTQTRAVTVAPTAGNFLVVSVSSYGSSSTHANHAVTDNIDGATGWTKVAGVNGNSSQVRISMWYKSNVPSGVTTVTVDAGASGSYAIGIVHEVANCTTFTTGEYATYTSAAATSTNPQTGGCTIGTAASAMFAILATADSANPANLTVNSTGTSGGTWALKSSTNSQETNAASYYPVSVPSVITTATGTFVHGWTTADKTYACIIGAFH